MAYRPWAALQASGIELIVVLPPGRETRFAEPPISDMESLAALATAALAPHMGEPFALFGHSLGALLAYEVARRLERNGERPRQLFVSGHQAPAIGSHRAPIAHLPDEGFLRGLLALGGTPREILNAPELLALLMPMLRADFAVAENYRPSPGPRLECPVTALAGAADPWVDAAGMAAWREVTNGHFESAMLPGDHFYLSAARAQLLAHIEDSLIPQPVAA